MKIISIAINNYRSFGTTNNILRVNNGVTTIIGMNESGKSNLIDAIGCLDLVNGITQNLNLSRNRINNKPIEFSIFLKGDGDPVDIVGSGTTQIILHEDKKYEIKGAAIDCYEAKLSSFDLIGVMESRKYGPPNERETVLTDIKRIQDFRSMSLAKTKTLLNNIVNHIKKYVLDENIKVDALKYVTSASNHLNCLVSYIPFLFLHKTGKELRSSYSLSEITPYTNDNKNSIDMQPNDLFLSLIKVVSIDHDELIRAIGSSATTKRETYENRVNRILEDKLMKSFREYYKKKTEDMKMTFRIEGNRLNIHVNSGDASIAFSERNNGLKWYLKMYIDLKAHIENARPIVYILDEPGIYLHINAQIELRNMFSVQAAGGTQIIYSTHSPYMIDANFACIRGIIKTGNDEYSHIMNSLYDSTFHSARSLDTLSPIAEAIGMDIASNLGADRNRLNIIVEGITDQIYINTMAKQLELDTELFNVIPSTGADNCKHLASILLGWGYPFIVLFDYDNKGRDCAKDLVESLNIEFGSCVFLLKEMTAVEFNNLHSIPEGESIVMEDMIAKADQEEIGIMRKEKKLDALRFKVRVSEKYALSDETNQAFNNLFNRIHIIKAK